MKKKAKSSRPRRGRRTSSAPQSLLILHLDADRLRADGLHLGSVAQFTGALSTIELGAPVVIEDATSTGHLHETLARLVTAKRTFDVVVAHSNAQGIRVASDLITTWDALAGYLKPLQPRRLLLAACRAGRWDAGDALFAPMPKLRRIFRVSGERLERLRRADAVRRALRRGRAQTEEPARDVVADRVDSGYRKAAARVAPDDGCGEP